MAFELVWEPRGVYNRYHGHVDDEVFMLSITKIECDSRFDDLLYVISDFLGVDDFRISEECVLVRSALDGAAAASNPNIRVAVVATDLQVQSLARFYAASPLNVYPTELFSNISDARAWLSSATPERFFRKRVDSR